MEIGVSENLVEGHEARWTGHRLTLEHLDIKEKYV